MSAVLFVVLSNAVPAPMRVSETLTDVPGVETEEFRHLQSVLLSSTATSGNRIELLENGEEIFAAKLKAINQARRSITFETFEFWGEDIGGAFADALADAAERGVAVHGTFDYLGSVMASGEKFKKMQKAGVDVVRWREPSWYQLSRFNNRTHRKLLIVDGKIGFTGGANTADPWQGHPDNGGYRENHYRFEGPVVAQLQNAFMQNWLIAKGQLLHSEAYFPLLQEQGEFAAKVVNSSPQEGTHRTRLMMLLAIAGSRDSLRLASPYFYPDDMIMAALLNARERGVSVDLMLPAEGHYSMAVREASMNRWGKLLEAGVQIHEYQPAKYHAKLYIVDEYWVSIGSSNLDNRSFRLNDETNVIIMNHDQAATLTTQYTQDLEQSKTFDLQTCENRPLMGRLL
ncbi:MAG: cardiolipin synthase B, partial [Halomonadaceae bacterium]